MGLPEVRTANTVGEPDKESRQVKTSQRRSAQPGTKKARTDMRKDADTHKLISEMLGKNESYVN